MKRPVAKKIISIAIMFTLLSGHIFLPLSVNADNEFLNYDNPNASGNNPYKISLSGIVSSGLLTSVVGCTGVVNKVSKVTSTFLSNLLQSKTEKAKRKLQKAQEDLAKKLVEEISGIAIQAAEATPGFPTADPGLRVQIIAKEKADKARAKALEQKLNIDQEAINTAVQRNQEEVAAASFREDCINGIAITLAKNQLTAMTKYTMNWVNTGFNGDPFFIRNVDSFITSIEDKILTEEINLFKNPENTTDLPYGRIFAQGAILENQSEKNFTNSMKQDLTSYLVPRATLNSFENDFSEGG